MLRYAPAAALMAIIVPDIALAHGALSISIENRASSGPGRVRSRRVDAQRLRDDRRRMLALTLVRQFAG